MGNSGSDFKSKVDTVDIELDFEIDPNAGQDEIRKFGYFFNKRGECRSVENPKERVGRFPSQREYEEFGAALERFVFYLLRTQYKMTEKIIGVNEDDDDDDNDDNQNDENNDQQETKDNDANDDNENDDNVDVDMTEDDKDKDKDKEEAPDKPRKKGMIQKSSKKDKGKKGSSSKPKRKSRQQISDDKIAKARIYLSPNYGEKETLLLLIPGSGAVRAGQWARSICINDNLAAGCMYPFIAEAYKRDWGVVLFDPNGRTDTGRVYSGEHVTYVYDKWVESMYLSKKDCKIKNVLIVCHSAGGMATTSLLNDKTKYLLPRIRGVAGTDTFFGRAQNKQIQEVYKKYIVNWVTSSQPLGTILSSTVPKRVSAGHNSHEYTSASAFPQIMSYFDAMLKMHKMLNVTSKDKGLSKGDDDGKKKKKMKFRDETETETEEKKEDGDKEKEKDTNKDNDNDDQCDANEDPETKDKATDNDNAKSDDKSTDDKSKKGGGDKMEVDNE